MVRALASHQCGPSLIPGPEVICRLSLLLVLVLALKVFLRFLQFFLPPQKPTFPNCNLIWNSRATGTANFSVTLSKQSLQLYLFIYLFIIFNANSATKSVFLMCLERFSSVLAVLTELLSLIIPTITHNFGYICRVTQEI